MHSQFCKRCLSSFVMGPAVILAVWFGKSAYEVFSIPLYTLMLAVMGTILSWEWEKMMRRSISSIALIMSLGACICAFVGPDNPSFALWTTLVFSFIVLYKSRGDAVLAFGVSYIYLPLISLVYLYYIDGIIARELVLWLFFVVWATDIGAYATGTYFKGPKICPRISPNKTWAGLVGGIGFAVLVAFVFALYLRDKYTNELPTALVPALVMSAGGLAVIAQIGDFFESYIKRKLNLKDTSNLIPGHGGLFDRVDGLLFAAVAMALTLFGVNHGWFS